MRTQYTDTVMMIEPVAFGFNEETADNNYFQQKDDTPLTSIQEKAHEEYFNMVKLLESKGIKVVSIKDTVEPHTPDSIFPNNWISFHKDNKVAIYPMYAQNRRSERRPEVIKMAKPGTECEVIDYTEAEKELYALEGTGSIILDRENMIAYAAISERTQPQLFEKFATDFSYKAVLFSSFQKVEDQCLPIYHTNVMMCVANKYAVICLDTIIYESERAKVETHLKVSGKEIIEISEEQMYQFAGNMLQVSSADGTLYLVMSKTAYRALKKDQIKRLEKYNEIITPSIPTIEHYGGGSVRCMMCEIF